MITGLPALLIFCPVGLLAIVPAWPQTFLAPSTFDKIPDTLDRASKKDIVSRIEQAPTVCAWVERMAADAGSRRLRAACGTV
nr:hypothetical protein GCM10020241_66410 [Streptoalloteichus tenebrarius]